MANKYNRTQSNKPQRENYVKMWSTVPKYKRQHYKTLHLWTQGDTQNHFSGVVGSDSV